MASYSNVISNHCKTDETDNNNGTQTTQEYNSVESLSNEHDRTRNTQSLIDFGNEVNEQNYSNENIKCDTCLKEPAEYRCNDCDMYMGGTCIGVHSRIPATRNHSVRKTHEPTDVTQSATSTMLQGVTEQLLKHSTHLESLSQRLITLKDKTSSMNNLIDESEKDIIAKTTEAHDRIRTKVKCYAEKEIEDINATIMDTKTQQSLLQSCEQLLSSGDKDVCLDYSQQQLAEKVISRSEEAVVKTDHVLQFEPRFKVTLPSIDKICKIMKQAKFSIESVSQTLGSGESNFMLIQFEDQEMGQSANDGHFDGRKVGNKDKMLTYEPLLESNPHLNNTPGQQNLLPYQNSSIDNDPLSNGENMPQPVKNENGYQANCYQGLVNCNQENASCGAYEEDVFDEINPEQSIDFNMDPDAISYVEEYEDIDMLLRKSQRIKSRTTAETMPKPRRKSSPNRPLAKPVSYNTTGRIHSHPAATNTPTLQGNQRHRYPLSPGGRDRFAIYASRQIKRNALYEFKHVPFAISVINRNLWIVKANFSIDILGFNVETGAVTKLKTIEVHSHGDSNKRKSWARFLGSGTIVYKTRSIVQTPQGKIIAACLGQLSGQDSRVSRLGLVMINSDGVIERVLASDWYNDVSVNGEFVYGLTGRTITIHKFVQNEWQMMARKITLDSFYYHLCVNNHIITLSDYAGHKVCQIHIDANGAITSSKILAKEGGGLGEFKCPRVCGYDQDNNVIICDTRNDRIQRLMADNTWQIMVDGQNMWPKDAIVIEQGQLMVVGLNRTLIRLSSEL